MKAVLEFNLPEDRGEFELAQKAGSLQALLQDFDNWLRGKIKYEDNLSDAEHDLLQVVRDELYSISRDLDVNIWS